ncbi:hypothetical protein IE81DRAFT_332801, partial [Ceraceosorus guamensis]
AVGCWRQTDLLEFLPCSLAILTSVIEKAWEEKAAVLRNLLVANKLSVDNVNEILQAADTNYHGLPSVVSLLDELRTWACNLASKYKQQIHARDSGDAENAEQAMRELRCDCGELDWALMFATDRLARLTQDADGCSQQQRAPQCQANHEGTSMQVSCLPPTDLQSLRKTVRRQSEQLKVCEQFQTKVCVASSIPIPVFDRIDLRVTMAIEKEKGKTDEDSEGKGRRAKPRLAVEHYSTQHPDHLELAHALGLAPDGPSKVPSVQSPKPSYESSRSPSSALLGERLCRSLSPPFPVSALHSGPAQARRLKLNTPHVIAQKSLRDRISQPRESFLEEQQPREEERAASTSAMMTSARLEGRKQPAWTRSSSPAESLWQQLSSELREAMNQERQVRQEEQDASILAIGGARRKHLGHKKTASSRRTRESGKRSWSVWIDGPEGAPNLHIAHIVTVLAARLGRSSSAVQIEFPGCPTCFYVDVQQQHHSSLSHDMAPEDIKPRAISSPSFSTVLPPLLCATWSFVVRDWSAA